MTFLGPATSTDTAANDRRAVDRAAHEDGDGVRTLRSRVSLAPDQAR